MSGKKNKEVISDNGILESNNPMDLKIRIINEIVSLVLVGLGIATIIDYCLR
jgi:hypothetical protein